jgi:hypothetical protein
MGLVRAIFTIIFLAATVTSVLAQGAVAYLVSQQQARSATGLPIVVCVYRTHNGQMIERPVPSGTVCPSSIRL